MHFALVGTHFCLLQLPRRLLSRSFFSLDLTNNLNITFRNIDMLPTSTMAKNTKWPPHLTFGLT